MVEKAEQNVNKEREEEKLHEKEEKQEGKQEGHSKGEKKEEMVEEDQEDEDQDKEEEKKKDKEQYIQEMKEGRRRMGGRRYWMRDYGEPNALGEEKEEEGVACEIMEVFYVVISETFSSTHFILD